MTGGNTCIRLVFFTKTHIAGDATGTTKASDGLLTKATTDHRSILETDAGIPTISCGDVGLILVVIINLDITAFSAATTHAVDGQLSSECLHKAAVAEACRPLAALTSCERPFVVVAEISESTIATGTS